MAQGLLPGKAKSFVVSLISTQTYSLAAPPNSCRFLAISALSGRLNMTDTGKSPKRREPRQAVGCGVVMARDAQVDAKAVDALPVENALTQLFYS